MASLNRIIMQRKSRRMLQKLDLAGMDAAEISGKHGRRFDFKSYTVFRYPKHDICKGPFKDAQGEVQQFDIILANQVWEHLDRPYAATRHVLEMLRPGGYFWIAVPFFIPFHGAPIDCSRWSGRGLKNLLIEAGFERENVSSWQWGNRQSALRNLEPDWPPSYDAEVDDLTNEDDFPLVSWALGKRSET
ncbi:MAG: methyltransferase domain-containing protein [Pseudomonadota bacterium]